MKMIGREGSSWSEAVGWVRRRGADEGADYMQMAGCHAGRYMFRFHPKTRTGRFAPKNPLTRFDSKDTGRERRTPQAVTHVLL